jgi:membrane-associated phospholipid phosphatase
MALTMIKKIALGFLLLFTLQTSRAQNIKSDTVPATKAEKKQEKKFYNAGQFLHESWLFVKSPTTWDKYSWIRFGLAVGVTAALMPFDSRISNATVGTKYYYSAPIVGGRVYGEWYSIGIVTVGFGTYGLLARDTNAKKISIELLQAGLYSEAITYLLKCTIGRARPYTNLGAFKFKPFSFLDYAYNSMPSGHMTSAMALSTVMSRNAKKTFWKIMAYVPAAFTMVSRLYQGQHFFSDEIFGSCVGYFVGNWVVNLHKERKHHIKVPVDLGTPNPQ